jgi:cell shape-determining protein MreD
LIDVIKNIARFISLLALQVLIFNPISVFDGIVTVHIYILFLLLLPLQVSGVLILLMAFITGLIADLFTGTIGLQTSAAVFLAGLRSFILPYIAPRDGYEITTKPSPNDLGWTWFLSYTVICTSGYFAWLFLFENFNFNLSINALSRTISSTIVTLIFINIIMLLNGPKSQKR